MIKGKHIQLRLVTHTDLPELYQKWHDAETRGPHYPLAIIPQPLFESDFQKNGFWSEQSKRLLIVDSQDKMLGLIHCGKASSYSDCFELSYILFDTRDRSKGFATEGVTLFSNYLFDNHRSNRLQIIIPEGNKASIRVAEKAGYKQEGILRDAYFLNGKDVDLHIYSLLRKEWQQ